MAEGDELKRLGERLALPQSVEVRTVEGMGRGVFATKPIPIGSEVLTCLPFAHCTSEEGQGTVCEHCLLPSQSLRRCGGCKFVHYCNTSCQRADWSEHKKECEAVRRVTPNRPTPLMRLVCRVVTKSQENEWAVDGLCSVPSLSGDKDGEVAFMTVLTQLLDHAPSSLHLILRKLTCNTFSVSSMDLAGVGVALYLPASLFNHSCCPNAVPVFTGPALSLRTIRPVAPGDQLFISYIETLQLRTERKIELKRTYGFMCGCVWCKANGTDQPDSSERRLLMDAQGKELSQPTLDRYLTKIQSLQARSNPDEVRSEAQALYNAHSTRLGHRNIFIIRLADILFHSSLQSGEWEKALYYSSLLVQPHLDHYGPLHPVTVHSRLRTGRLRRLVATTQQLHLSVTDLTQARDAAEVVFGCDHAATQEANQMLQDSLLELSHRQR